MCPFIFIFLFFCGLPRHEAEIGLVVVDEEKKKKKNMDDDDDEEKEMQEQDMWQSEFYEEDFERVLAATSSLRRKTSLS